MDIKMQQNHGCQMNLSGVHSRPKTTYAKQLKTLTVINMFITDKYFKHVQSTDSTPRNSNYELLQAVAEYDVNKNGMSSDQPRLLTIEYPVERLYNSTNQNEKHEMTPSSCDCLQSIENMEQH